MIHALLDSRVFAIFVNICEQEVTKTMHLIPGKNMRCTGSLFPDPSSSASFVKVDPVCMHISFGVKTTTNDKYI